MTQSTSDQATAAVAVSVDVAAPQARAFEVFTAKFSTWWPASHHIGEETPVDIVLEPREGGRWYEVGANGVECEWGSVVEWRAPDRIVLRWQLDPSFQFEPDRALATFVEVRFVPTGADSTRVELEHRGFEVHGERGAGLRTSVSAPDGWHGIMTAYAAAA